MKLNSCREFWLNSFINAVRPKFKDLGIPLPHNIRASMGFPTGGRRYVGECWSPDVSTSDTVEIFISPVLQTDYDIANILVHELIHAAIGTEKGHNKEFKHYAKLLGFDYRNSSKVDEPTEITKSWIKPILKNIGKSSHTPMLSEEIYPNKMKTQNLVKCWCPYCDITLRMSKKWIVKCNGILRCPDRNCGAILIIKCK